MDKQRFSTPLLFVVLLFVLLSGVGWQAIGKAAPLSASLDVPFFSQTALRNQTVSNGRAPTLGNSDLLLWEYGCGVASLAMVYRQYGVDTDVTRLNDALHASGGFVGGLLAWDKTDAFLQAGAPWVKGIERINTTRPQDFQARIAAALDNGESVLAYLNGQHYVVITGKEGDSYLINDPWAVTADTGKDIAMDKNLLAKGGFDSIRQLVFVSRQEYAPSNGVLVQAAIRDKYIASRGAQGPLGNPLQPQESLTGGGVWQPFENGAIFAPANAKPTLLFGPVWEKFQAEGGVAKFGLPRSDVYSYFVGPAVEWRADFANASILWTEGDRPDRARTIDAANGVRADYFANPNLSGQPAYSRYESDLLFDWRDGAPGPWVNVDNFSARFTQTFRVGGLGWRYNFLIDADSGVRVRLDGKLIVDAWDQPGQTRKFNRNLWRGQHELVVEYRHTSGNAHLRFARSDWPATPVFAAENTVGSFETLPVSVTDYVRDLPEAVAAATPRSTPTPAVAIPFMGVQMGGGQSPATGTNTPSATQVPSEDERVLAAATSAFEQWAKNNGEPYRDVQAAVKESDGFFATAQVIAWFRPQRESPWEEREAQVECRKVGGVWQCDARFVFALTGGELARRFQALPDHFGLEFVHVLAGEFMMGSSEAQVDTLLALCNQFYDNNCGRAWFENAKPQHTVALDEFWIAKTEVTNAQYRAFVEAGGYAQPEVWTAAGWQWRQDNDRSQPGCWGAEEWNQPDHPVVCVSWYESVAYADWLARETGLPIRLPSEAEWEKAARGTDGRLWPWGIQPPDGARLNFCDINCESDWKDASVDDGYPYTAPVGSYPAGASPYGALDMAGNVWEWTSSFSEDYPYRDDDGREERESSQCCRVVRGGAWDDALRSAAAAVRYWHNPADGSLSNGFRVVVVQSASIPVP